jgi:hypothetical protein
MRAFVFVGLLALAAAGPSLAVAAQTRADTPCAAFGRSCGCPSYVRDCQPACHIPPRIKCEPVS